VRQMTTRTYVLGLSNQHVSAQVPEDYAGEVGEFGLWA
jgi:hypothetical protein